MILHNISSQVVSYIIHNLIFVNTMAEDLPITNIK